MTTCRSKQAAVAAASVRRGRAARQGQGMISSRRRSCAPRRAGNGAHDFGSCEPGSAGGLSERGESIGTSDAVNLAAGKHVVDTHGGPEQERIALAFSRIRDGGNQALHTGIAIVRAEF